jgi:DnaJ-domain-containing protein 1
MSAGRRRRAEARPERRGSSLDRWLVLIAVVLGVLIYLRSPIDLLPDRMGLIGLVDDLLAAVAATWWLRRRFPLGEHASPRARPHPRPRVPPSEPSGTSAWDPYRVLDVARGASAEEITRAYRDQMKLYHPDRVAELGTELQHLAHEKSIEIQRAYEEIGPRRG